jgi:hypothetical protein
MQVMLSNDKPLSVLHKFATKMSPIVLREILVQLCRLVKAEFVAKRKNKVLVPRVKFYQH